MDYTKLGNTGMDVSRICLGAMSFGDPNKWFHKWVLEEEDSRPIIKRALELGINFFDTANVYSLGRSEEILGKALKDYAKRDEIVLATKVHQKMFDGPNGQGLSRKAIMSQIDQSLQRLQTDYVDLYIIHRWDYDTPIEETMEALHDVVKSGKARLYWCFSNACLSIPKSQSCGRKKWLDQICFDAKSFEFNISRRRKRNDSLLCRPRNSTDAIQSLSFWKIG